jgi:hypothetical protein
VRRDVIAAARSLIAPTLAVLVVAAFLPGRLALSVRLYALVVCVAVMVVALAALRRAYPPATPLGGSGIGSRGQTRPPSLDRMGTIVALGVSGSFDLHHRLRPRVRSLAAGLLSSRRRISLDGQPAQARAALGDEAYDLVRANRPPPQDRLARGMPLADLRRVVDALEHV